MKPKMLQTIVYVICLLGEDFESNSQTHDIEYLYLYLN